MTRRCGLAKFIKYSGLPKQLLASCPVDGEIKNKIEIEPTMASMDNSSIVCPLIVTEAVE
ncbi:hypothetical protein I7I50_04296 [Histoplasma capsulatum G186AR]|uniref:Uncharacterized protein n=1 Tax=Ajellomyces capsulatus TaxID=5037 RepID=A0A8H7YQ91_AJECA|nr:hypothetical protein I7I52_05204 [Histoplasma capsulatum]QSS75227.1 hypothetical protein I7I50_04296 [Histoplasma capsulatum G186AR]